MSEIRKDPLSNTCVIIAPERASRPHAQEKEEDNQLKTCPFCEKKGVKSQVLPYATCAAEFDKNGNWITQVISNKYPALTPKPQLKEKEIDNIYYDITGVGGHEILIESPNHKDRNWAIIPLEQLQAVLRNYRCRYSYWRKDKRISYLSIFRNYGKRAGASISHPHSQMIATPFIPPRVKEQLDKTKKYYKKNKRCLICRLIKDEVEIKERFILENDDFVIIASFAPRFPYETLIIPKMHQSSFKEITDKQIENLAALISGLFKRYDKLLNNPPYNLILYVSPLKSPDLPYYHWHIEIIPKLSQPAGFEWGSGAYINSVAPEIAAKRLKDS